MKPIIPTLLLISLISCERPNTKEACNGDYPLEELTWLKNLKQEYDRSNSQSRITQYTYQGERVFLVNECIQCPDAMTYLYDCEENTLCIFGSIGNFNSCPNFGREASNEIILYDK